MLRDLRLATRLLAKSPIFTAAAALLLAIGIGSNTLIFSVINALLLRPLPVLHPENLVRLVEVHPNGFVTWALPYDLCDALAAREGSQNSDLSAVLCQGEADVAFRDGTFSERIRVHLVSPNFFSSLGVSAHIGRLLTADDERTLAHNVVVSYGFWQTRFHGDLGVLGRSIILGGHPFTIVGVSPEGFNGLAADTSPELRVSAAVDRLLVKPDGEMNPAARPLFAQIFGRLRDGVPLARANAAIDPLLRAAYQEESQKLFPPAKGAAPGKSALDSHLCLESAVNGVSVLRPQFSRGLNVLMGGVALLLIMACANVAGLLLARSAARAGEIGIRLALGAGPQHIVRQLLAEGILLALLGGAGGILLAIACLPLLVRALPPIRDRAAVLQPIAVHVHIDLRVVAFTVGITFLAAVLSAASPGWRSTRTDVSSVLRAARTATRRLRTRDLIVMAQVATCTLLLMGAALLVETLEHMRSMNPGFDRDHVVTFTIDPSLSAYSPEQSRAFSQRVLDQVRQLPGIRAASIAARAVMRGTGVKATFGVAGSRIAASDFLNSSLNEVTPEYFETMGMHLVAGRAFNWLDRNTVTPHRVLVNQTFARRFFPNQDPLGRRFGFPGSGDIAMADHEVIGVVSDAKYRSLREPIPPTVYSPAVDGFDSAFILHLRTSQHPEAMIAPVRELLRSLSPDMPVIEVRTLREEVEASLWQERLLAWLSTLFGAIAVLLTGIGLYGALDYALKSRARGIGVRMALGAQPARIVGLFSRDALWLAISGLALGLCAYSVAAVWLRRVLYDLRPWEPDAMVLVAVLVGGIAGISAAPVAWRSVRIDPASTLRSE